MKWLSVVVLSWVFFPAWCFSDDVVQTPSNSINWVIDEQSQTYQGDGRQTDFKVTFPFSRRAWIRPFLQTKNGPTKEIVDGQFTWLNEDTVRLNQAPDAGSTLALHGTNGIRMSRDPNVLHAFFITGQSNAAASNYDPAQAAIATKPIYPGFALMPRVGVRPNGKRYSDFADLVETGSAGNVGLKETGASSLANHFIRDVDRLFGFKPRVFCAVVAKGGQSLAEIGPGSSTCNNLLLAVQDCVAAARSHGWRVIVPAVPFNQGESDVPAASRSAYGRELMEFQRFLETQIRAITGQVEPVVLFLTQTRMTTPRPGDEPVISLAQLDVDGLPGIRLAAPMYQYGRSDRGHLDVVGQNRQGQAWERAILAECYGQGWSPLRPVRWRWASATEIDIQFHVPAPPLVLDSTGEVEVKGMMTKLGFDFADDSAQPPLIARIELLAKSIDTVRVTLSGPSKGPRPWLSYATRRDNDAAPYDRTGGGRGCLHDSAKHRSLYDQKLNDNWCVMFAIDLPPAAAHEGHSGM